jgi:hypothetical protein
LLKQVKPLSSEDILRLFVGLEEIHALGLADDRMFITRNLPLVSGSLLQLLGAFLREGSSWAACKSQLLVEYILQFLGQKLRDIIAFYILGEWQSRRVYMDQAFQATEQQLVERVVMNFHPDIFSQAACLDEPRSHKDLHRVGGFREEKLSISKLRRRLQ